MMLSLVTHPTMQQRVLDGYIPYTYHKAAELSNIDLDPRDGDSMLGMVQGFEDNGLRGKEMTLSPMQIEGMKCGGTRL